MTRGVFLHREDSRCDDLPAERYQFPGQYLSRASQFVGDWIIYYEPVKVRNSKGYYAMARVQSIVQDPTAPSMHLAMIEPGSYLDFERPVPFTGPEGWPERGVLNEAGQVSGRAQAAVRPISLEDFNRILDLGMPDEDPLLPTADTPADASIGTGVAEERTAFIFDDPRARVASYTKRIVRDRIFRRKILEAYDSRCAITGLKLINGGGRAEVQAAHIKPVEANGPDIVTNGLALSGTAHWMFDRGLISLGDDLEVLVSRQVNDAESIWGLVNRTRRAAVPSNPSHRPHPAYLAWHRELCFKR